MLRTGGKFSGWWLICALGLTILLAATISGESLWTDEAFSAFMASHRSLRSLWSTLLAGDSSDLQMAMYYVYLFFWGKLFGLSEVAFRTANIPFGLVFSGVLVWMGQRFFTSRTGWIAAALSPLMWSFANDARPYFAIVALSSVCVACLVVYLDSGGSVTSAANRKAAMPWMVITSLLVGATFHMLMLLLVAPLCVMLFTVWRANRAAVRWSDWKTPLAVLSPFALAEAIFFAWTFRRGATYEYAHPDLLSMASVLFRFAGLSGYAPNRRYDIAFRPYVPGMMVASLILVTALAALWMAARRSNHWLIFSALASALAIGVLQVAVMSIAIKQQVEVRHMASLLPLLLFAILAGLSCPIEARWNRTAHLCFGLMCGVWLVSALTITFSPDYRREDFRSAVRKALEVSSPNVDIAVVADPAAAAYYGLAVQGTRPCFPLSGTCAEGFAKVPWVRRAQAEYAVFWPDTEVAAWLAAHKTNARLGVLLITRSRHPMYTNSPWWREIQYSQYSRLYSFHGFFLYVFL